MSAEDWKVIVARADHPLWRILTYGILYAAVALGTANNPDSSELKEDGIFVIAAALLEFGKHKARQKTE